MSVISWSLLHTLVLLFTTRLLGFGATEGAYQEQCEGLTVRKGDKPSAWIQMKTEAEKAVKPDLGFQFTPGMGPRITLA